MFKNYYILNRLVCELNEVLSGTLITEAYTQEKNRLYLRISNEHYPDRHLVISADQNFPFLFIKEKHHRAKKNYSTFFESFFPDKIESVYISESDRIIRISLTGGNLYFLIRGPHSNIVYSNNHGDFLSFKKMNEENKRELSSELDEQEWNALFNLPDFTVNEINDWDDIKRLYPAIGAEIKRELSSKNVNNLKADITNLLTAIARDKITVFYSENLEKVLLTPESSLLAQGEVKKKVFETVYEAMAYYVSFKYKSSNSLNLQKQLDKYLNKELSSLSNKLNKLKKRVEIGSKEEEYNHRGSLLLANLGNIRKGEKKIEVYDYISDKKLIIPLDPKLSPNKNVDVLFQKSKDEKINFEKSVGLFKETEEKYKQYLNIYHNFEKSESLIELEKIAEELKISKNDKRKPGLEEQIKYRHFLLGEKYHVYVGRDNKNNDLVTFKMAKQNDLWFHARGVPGSHVVLRIDNPKEPVPKNILKDVASIAAHYSKAKTAGTVPVAYTFRKYVRKKKGMEPGKVILERETVLLVRPDMPSNCKHIED